MYNRLFAYRGIIKILFCAFKKEHDSVQNRALYASMKECFTDGYPPISGPSSLEGVLRVWLCSKEGLFLLLEYVSIE